MTRPSQLKATIFDPRTVAWMVAPLSLVPALAFNVDWSAGISSKLAIANASTIIAVPVLIAAVFWAKSVSLRALFAVGAAFMMALNVSTAFKVASHSTSEARDHRATIIASFERLKAQSVRLSNGRRAAAMVAGEAPAAAIAAELERVIAAGARRWATTDGCRPQATTAAASIRLCEQVAALRVRKVAAERRDALDTQLDRLSRDMRAVSAPADADPFTASVVILAGVIDWPLSPSLVQALPAIWDGSLGLALELIACLVPLAAVSLCSDQGPRPQPVSVAKAVRASTSREVVKAEPVKPVDQFAAFVTARLEKETGGVLRAGDAFKSWQEHCAEHGGDVGTQKAFGARMGERFKHDKNNGRPVYRGVRIRVDLGEHVVPFKKRTA